MAASGVAVHALLMLATLTACDSGCERASSAVSLADGGAIAMSTTNVHITELGGSTPVEGEGTLADGRHFYFRARYEAWAMLVGDTYEQAFDNPAWAWREPWGESPFSAGYMSEDTAREIIVSCAAMIAENVPPPREYVGLPEAEVEAGRLAQAFVGDICTYQGDQIRDAGSPRNAVTGPIEEARAVYRARVAAAYHPLFEDELVQIDACAENGRSSQVALRRSERAQRGAALGSCRRCSARVAPTSWPKRDDGSPRGHWRGRFA